MTIGPRAMRPLPRSNTLGRACTVCTLPQEQREEIDKALIAGEPVRSVASRYVTIGRMAMQRHKDEHLSQTLAKAHEAGEVARADDLLAQVRGLRSKAISILMQAERAGDLRTALMGVREARACIELLAEMAGELDRNPQINILIASPAWQQTRDAIMRGLSAHPAARDAVVRELLSLGAG